MIGVKGFVHLKSGKFFVLVLCWADGGLEFLS